MSTGPNRNPDHFNYKHGMCNSPEYYTWVGMKSRCDNYHDPDYGGRGITYPDKWADFLGFYEDMGHRPEGTTLDRLDNDKGYSKENCAWRTSKEQNANRRYMSYHPRNKSGMIGLDYRKERDVWRARFRQKLIYQGPSKEEAVRLLEIARGHR